MMSLTIDALLHAWELTKPEICVAVTTHTEPGIVYIIEDKFSNYPLYVIHEDDVDMLRQHCRLLTPDIWPDDMINMEAISEWFKSKTDESIERKHVLKKG
jgi:hypothetical protein